MAARLKRLQDAVSLLGGVGAGRIERTRALSAQAQAKEASMAKQRRVRIPAGHRPWRHTRVMRDKRSRRARDKLRRELSY